MDKLLLDANVLVRFLRGDHAEHSAAAARLVDRAEEGDGKLVLLAPVLAETVYMLSSVYECPASSVADALKPFLTHGAVECPESGVLDDALTRYATTGLDFMDCYLAAVARSRDLPVVSFDRDFRKFTDIRWYVPKS